MPYDEDSLQGRLLAGDDDALALVRRWIADSLSAARFWRLRGEWRDLQQEVLSRLVASLRRERFRSDGELKSYVQGICRHTAQTRLAERVHRPVLAAGVDPADIPSTGDTEKQVITDQLVRRALEEASTECREMIRAYFLEELSYAELASRFGVPVGTAKSRLFRCLRCLRESIGSGAPRPVRPAR
ncbi:MAG TPA: sigma-70 family RNA polymerase sigma factor [Candidatus Polarisedimenticolia bacterium]|jgi:RNA polymerase sigma-70 factor (ECF subfamily)